jgi:predicted nucleotidyltransferase
MDLAQIKKYTPQIMLIGKKHGIRKVFVIGSVARGQGTHLSDVDFLVELDESASLFGIAGFGYEVEKLLGIRVDVIPKSLLSQVKDRQFSESILRDAISL